MGGIVFSTIKHVRQQWGLVGCCCVSDMQRGSNTCSFQFISFLPMDILWVKGPFFPFSAQPRSNHQRLIKQVGINMWVLNEHKLTEGHIAFGRF